MSTPSTTPLADDPGLFPQGLIWDPATETQELFGVWSGAWSIWGDYLSRLSAAPGPVEMFEAGEQLMADSMQICGRVVSARLRDSGVRAPLLNDA